MSISQIPSDVNPLSPDQAMAVQGLLGSMTPFQQAWLSGYLAASAGGNTTAAPAPQAVAAPATLTVLYGSQTGNARHVAEELAEAARARGLAVALTDMADYKPQRLKDETHLIIVTSTYGEGEPPEPAQKLYDFVGSRKAPKLDGVQVAVLGLGDTSYEHFCKTALDFEERLSALGAEVVVERALLDVDYEDYTSDWIEGALTRYGDLMERAAPSNVLPMAAPVATSAYTKKNPFEAEVLAVQKITGRDSTRDVRHVEISLEGSGLTYRAGDALGVYFQNDEGEIASVLELLELDGTSEVKLGDNVKTLAEALRDDLELTQSYPGFVAAYAEVTDNEALTKLAGDKDALRAYLEPRQIYDILRDHPAAITPQALVDALRKMQPRLYSIASSPDEVEDEVHLTVGVVDYEAHGAEHLGGASGHLGRRVVEGDRLRVFVEKNDAFRLPDNPDTPTIMIGPGTGIAPFRAFLQERDARGAEGENWLFFGNPHFTQDFLYQVELQSYLKSGLLTKLDVAFSRDQAEKVYVQHRLIEQGAEVWAWLEKGAHLYVCGDATRMARDVEAAVLEVIAHHGGKSSDEAQAYLAQLRDDKRLARDVY